MIPYHFPPPADVYSGARIAFCNAWNVSSDRCTFQTGDLLSSVWKQLPDFKGLFKELERNSYYLLAITRAGLLQSLEAERDFFPLD